VATRASAASEAHVAQAARDAIAEQNAVDAVVTAVLVAAAEAPAVFLGPLQILVGGAGAGLLAFDGRVRQPGLGVPRPRGVVAGGPVPPQARVGVPALPAALAAALASLGSISVRRACGPAIERARALSAERAATLEAFSRRAAAAMTDDAVAGELTAVAGRAAGGALTREDLTALRPGMQPCQEAGDAGIVRVPWRAAGADGSAVQVVAATDPRGLVAIACYEAPVEGLAVPGLGLVAPAFASPVMRGETRVRPGEPCPAAAPIALRARRGLIDLAIGVASTGDADGALEALLARLDEATPVVESIRGAPGRVVAVARTRESAVAVAAD
jgi:hypothetical protein